jgi:hypothetical protein
VTSDECVPDMEGGGERRVVATEEEEGCCKEEDEGPGSDVSDGCVPDMDYKAGENRLVFGKN